MKVRRAAIGLSVLCALMFSAIAAQGAFAATSGTTAFTCVPVEPAQTGFSDAHCKTPSSSGHFVHKVLAANPTPEIEGTNAATKNETKEAEPAVLLTTAGGLETEIVCTTVSSTGTLENVLTGEVHLVKGTGVVIKYSGCTVPKPASQGCKIPSGTITTNTVKSETVGETSVKFSPATGTEFVSITFEGCKTAGLNKAYAVIGTVSATPSGATLNVNIAKNAESTLEFGGQKAGLKQVETLKMKGGNPISLTKPPFTVVP